MFGSINRAIVTIAALGVVALVAAPVASAHTVEVVGGKTKLELNERTASKLDKKGISLNSTAYAVKGGSYSFHALDDGGGGEIAHKGSMTFKVDGAKAKLSRLDIDVPVAEAHARRHGEEAHLSAVVGGERIEVATLGTKNYALTENYPGFEGLEAKLNKKAAKLLNSTLGVNVFKEGMKLGALSNKSKIEEHAE